MGPRAAAAYTGAGNDQVPFELRHPTKHRHPASSNEREVALAAPMAASVFNRSRERASRSSLVTTSTSRDIAYRTNLYLNRAPSASMSPVVGCGKWIGKTYW